MEIKKVVSVCFSPTGSTRRVLSEIAAALPWPSEELDLTAFKEAPKRVFQQDELLLVGAPVYGGRVPSVAAERLGGLRGCRTPAVAVAVYGNRDYDDALLELADIAADRGFLLAAAAAAVAEHNIMRSVAAGRPDRADLEFLRGFAEKTAEKLKSVPVPEQLPRLSLKGGFPYKEFGGVPYKPHAGAGCVKCGRCAALCPVGAIPAQNPDKTDGDLCITCMRCVNECPAKARSLEGALPDGAEEAFFMKYSERKEPEAFI